MKILSLENEINIEDIIDIANRARDGKDIILFVHPNSTFYKLKLTRKHGELKMSLAQKLKLYSNESEKDIKTFFGTYYPDYLDFLKSKKGEVR